MSRARENDAPPPLTVFFFRNGDKQRDYRWAGRGLHYEVGTRVWSYMLDADRIKEAGWGWPRPLEEWEKLHGDA